MAARKAGVTWRIPGGGWCQGRAVGNGGEEDGGPREGCVGIKGVDVEGDVVNVRVL